MHGIEHDRILVGSSHRDSNNIMRREIGGGGSVKEGDTVAPTESVSFFVFRCEGSAKESHGPFFTLANARHRVPEDEGERFATDNRLSHIATAKVLKGLRIDDSQELPICSQLFRAAEHYRR
jgi:hypothetical protein